MDSFEPRWSPRQETDEAFEARYRAAAQRGIDVGRTEPRAAAIAFDSAARQVRLTLTNGAVIAFAPEAVPELQSLSDAELAEGRVLGAGGGVGWDVCDVHISVPGLVLALTFGPEWRRTMRGYMNAELAGSKSEAKAAAARTNGRKGGRPRKAGAEKAEAIAERAPQAKARSPRKSISR